jgi:hypothetical protein
MNSKKKISSLSTEVRAFIDKNISCYEDLQILLLLHSHPEREWDAVDVADQLRIEPFAASGYLMGLFERGLLEHPVQRGTFHSFQYTPYPDIKDKQVSELAAAFESTRLEIVDYITKRNRPE